VVIPTYTLDPSKGSQVTVTSPTKQDDEPAITIIATGPKRREKALPDWSRSPTHAKNCPNAQMMAAPAIDATVGKTTNAVVSATPRNVPTPTPTTVAAIRGCSGDR
jgi:hypothetical protein